MALINPITAGQGLDPGGIPSTARDQSIAAGLGQLGNAVGQAADALGQHELRRIAQQQKIEEFRFEQEWQRTQLAIAADYDQRKLNMDPSGQGFAENADKAFISQYETFLQSVPEHLKPRFAELVATDKEGRLRQAAADEVDQRNRWYEVGITDTVNGAQTAVAAQPELFDQRLADVHRTIDASGLPPAKKADLKRQAQEMLGRAWFERLMRDNPAFAKTQLGVGFGSDGDTAALIRSEEGLRTSAYADTRTSTGAFDAYRVGYGSDTITLADGTVKKVTASTVIRPEDAERDLQRRIKEFQKTIIGQIGADQWAALPPSARAGLTSVAYNYGSLPSSVVNAAKSGNINAIAAAVGKLGANPERRAREAAVIRGGMEPAPQVAALPFNERAQMFDQAAAAEHSLLSAQAAQDRARYDAEKGRLELAIELGEVASRQSILSAPLTDSDKATLINKLEAQQGRNASAQAFLDAYNSGLVGQVNPYDGDQRKVVGDAFDLLMKATPEDQRNAVAASYVADTGVVPDQVVASVRRNLNAQDVAQVAAGLAQAAAIYDAAPNGLDAVEHGKELQDAAATFRELVTDRGLDVNAAAAEVLRSRDPDQRRKAKELDDAWDALMKDTLTHDPFFQLRDVLKEFDFGLFAGGAPAGGVTPDQVAALTADYVGAAERAFKGPANGDEGVARQIALTELLGAVGSDGRRRGGIYGVSEVSGQRVLMKFPPESYYPERNGGHGYIRDLALKDAREAFPDAQNVMLRPLPQTASDVRARRAPKYYLFYQRPDAIWDLMPGEFGIEAEPLAALEALDAQEREIRFAMERQAEESRQANPGPTVFVTGQTLNARPPVDPALAQRLEDVRRRRNETLGKPASELEFSDSFMDEIRTYQEQQGFGAFGAQIGARP